MKQTYSFQGKESIASRALGKDLPVSLKHAIEICNYVRGNSLAVAKKKLSSAIALERPIPFKRFTDGVGHRKGDLASGRFVVKASKELLALLSSAEANALNAGFAAKDLYVLHMSAQQAAQAFHNSSRGRRTMKRCHIEIVLGEKKGVGVAKSAPKTVSKSQASETKKEAPKQQEPKKESSPKAEAKEAPKAAAVKKEEGNNSK